MEFIGGAPENTVETWHSLGQAARRLNAIADFPVPYGIATQEAIRELREDAASHTYKEQYLHFIDLLLPVLEFPLQGLIHGEINLSNALRRENGEVVIIDWDEAGTGRIVLDAGYPLITTFLSEDLDFSPELGAAYYKGYYGQNWPVAGEIEMVFCAALLHALRYMRFWNQQKRWERICYAVAHKDELLSAVF
jgi:aminoglycoside phosphotransferase (APT) family kinase protein